MKSQLQAHRNVWWCVHTTLIFGIVLGLSGCGDDSSDVTESPTKPTCQAGTKVVSKPAEKTCKSEKCDGMVCCEANAGTCAAVMIANLNNAGSICGDGKSWDFDKSGAVAGDTAAEKKTNCCGAKQKCSEFTCPPGAKRKPNAAEILCAGIKCEEEEAKRCCDNDDKKCMSLMNEDVCGTDRWMDYAKLAQTFEISKKDEDCCTAKSKCSSSVCKEGWEVVTDEVDKFCSDRTCSKCCKKKSGTCHSAGTNPCVDGTHWDHAKDGMTTGDTKEEIQKNCCTKDATCEAYV